MKEILECGVPAESGKTLFNVLDIWASVFISRFGKVLVVPAMVSSLGKALASLPGVIKQEDKYLELKDYFSELEHKFDDFELESSHPFNTVMCEFMMAHKADLSEDGRKVLINVQEVLGCEPNARTHKFEVLAYASSRG
jgi:hypothetical protein